MRSIFCCLKVVSLDEILHFFVLSFDFIEILYHFLQSLVFKAVQFVYIAVILIMLLNFRQLFEF